MPGDPGRPVVIVGGGATAAFLLHGLATAGGGRPVVVVDPAPRIGPGVAYGTDDPTHLMNVCRIRLSADGDDGSDLTAWLAARGLTADADTYLRRSQYGDYLADVAARSAAALGAVHRRARVVGVRPDDAGTGPGGVAGGGWQVDLDDGRVLAAADVVLATGFPGRPALPCPALPAADPRQVIDPWVPGVLARPDVARVVIVGTGLTMVDVALSLQAANPGVELVAVSRRGLVPRSSRPGLPAPVDPRHLPVPGLGLRDLVRQVVDLGRQEPGDWQAVVDSVRPRANDLWWGLSAADQARVLHRWFPWWNVHRHRTAPAVGRALAATVDRGQLRVVRGRVESVTAPRSGAGPLAVRVGGAGGGLVVEADLVVNAAGPRDDLAAADDPLLRSLLDAGRAVIGPHRLGLAVDRDGRALGADGRSRPGLWVTGALRRGTEFETTAVPEIRVQAAAVAERLLHGDHRPVDTSVAVGRC